MKLFRYLVVLTVGLVATGAAPAQEKKRRLLVIGQSKGYQHDSISTAMATAGLNIHNMVNKSRGDMAYTLVDVDSPVADGVLESLRSIAGVLSVRYLPHRTP